MKKTYPTPAEYEELVSQWKKFDAQGDDLARNRVGMQIFKGAEGFIWHHIHRRMRGWRPEDKQDAFSEAVVWLFDSALPNYDQEMAKACKSGFSTYFNYYLLHAITAFKAKATMVKVPIYKRQEAVRKLNAGEELTPELWACLPTVVYWDRAVTVGSDPHPIPLSEILAPKNGYIETPKGFETVLTDQRWEKVDEYLSDPQLRQVIFGRAKGKTLQEIGDEIGVTREWVRRLEKKALDKLQRRCNIEPAALSRLKSSLRRQG